MRYGSRYIIPQDALLGRTDVLVKAEEEIKRHFINSIHPTIATDVNGNEVVELDLHIFTQERLYHKFKAIKEVLSPKDFTIVRDILLKED